jgi:tRNA(Ile)-lysidine synthase
VSVRKILKKRNISVEEAAREVRYGYFLKTAGRKKIRKIALGHTRNDQAETVLMRVLQGTGLRGLCGIRPELRLGKVRFVRPLLDFSKEELRGYLKSRRIPFRTDSSNRSVRLLRNRLRMEIIPRLEKTVNPRVVDALARLPGIAAEESGIIEALEKEAWSKSFKAIKRGRLWLRREAFRRIPPPLRFRLLDRALKKLDARSGLAFEAWRRLCPHLEKKSFRISLPRDIDLELTSLAIVLYKKSVRTKASN